MKDLRKLSVISCFSKPQLQATEKLMEYLITLGSSSMSKSFLIGHILSQISDLADRLWQAFQVNASTASPHLPLSFSSSFSSSFSFGSVTVFLSVSLSVSLCFVLLTSPNLDMTLSATTIPEQHENFTVHIIRSSGHVAS